MKYSKLMSFIHHFPLQLMNILSIYYWIKAKIKLKHNKNKKLYIELMRFLKNKKEIKKRFKTPLEYIDFIKMLKYKSDGYKGLAQHYNTLLECVVLGLDCDGYARLIKWGLKKLYNIDSVWFGIRGDKITSWHYDAYMRYNGELIIANQGHYKVVENLYIMDLGPGIATTAIDYKKSVIEYIKSDKYMSGNYKNLKAYWECHY